MSKEEKKVNRRDFLFTASYTVGAVGVGAVIWPMIDQMNPDKAQQALATTEVDISSIEPGKSITVLWRGKPVFLKRRTSEEIAEARAVKLDDLPDPQKDEDRVKEGKDEWLVMLGVCTHLGCVPLGDKGDYNGWFCPCHGSHYDISGRIRTDSCGSAGGDNFVFQSGSTLPFTPETSGTSVVGHWRSQDQTDRSLTASIAWVGSSTTMYLYTIDSKADCR